MAGFLLASRKRFRLDTERLILRLPEHGDFRIWAALRESSADFLVPWEPTWSTDHLSRRAFTGRVQWAARVRQQGTGLPLFLVRRDDDQLLGAITLDNIRRGPAQAGTVGYWIGQPFARSGYMREALTAVVHHAFTELDLSRIRGRLPAGKHRLARGAGEIRLQVRGRGAILPADQRPLAQPRAVRQPAGRPAGADGCRLSRGSCSCAA